MNPDRRLEIGRGEGTVVALPGIAMLVVGAKVPDDVLEIARAAAATQPPGRDLARRLAGLLTGDHGGDVPPFGAVAEVDDGLLLFLSGPVTATTISDDGAEVRLSGSEATTWVDRVLGPEPGSVVIAPDAASVEEQTPFELAGGVVPAGWLRITDAPGAQAVATSSTAVSAPAPAPEVALSPEPEPEPEAAAAPDVPSDPAPAPAPEPAPVSEPDVASEAAPVSEPEVAAAPAPVSEPDVAPEPAAAPEPEVAPAPEPQTPAASTEPETSPLDVPTPVAPPPIPPPPGSTAADAPAEEPPTEALPTSFESFSLEPDAEAVRAPLPSDAVDAQEPESTVEPVPERKMVQGIMCSRHHFNSPDSAYCSSCGISMVHATHNLVTRERPPLGFLVFDDGSTFTLDDRYVLGREPETDPLVRDEQARSIPLEDPQMSVSRIHAEIQLVGWDVQLLDRGSTNGTHILNERGDGWDRLAPEQPRIVAPGSRVAVGQRTFVYETPQRG